MVRIDVEDTAEQRGTVGRAIGDERSHRRKMQRRQMIGRDPQRLRTERLSVIRPSRRKMLRRLQHNPIDRLAHDATRPLEARCGLNARGRKIRQSARAVSSFLIRSASSAVAGL